MPKIYKYGEGKAKHLSDFEADSLIKQIPKSEKKPQREYELVRTSKGVIYQTNRRQRTKYSFKIKRLCALLAKRSSQNIIYDEKTNIILINNTAVIIADRVRTEEEQEYHINKAKEKYPSYEIEIVSLSKSNLVPSFKMDTKTIENYYKKDFKFPMWFREYLKMRSFRVMNTANSFAFSSRRYNDTSKWTAEQKLVNDLVRQNKYGDPGKIYFTLARMLDSKLDRTGKGFPLKNLILLVLDVDGKCDGMHEINSQGICIKCMNEAFEKERKVKQILLESKYPLPIKTLFSGGKGLHLHFCMETTQDKMKEIIDFVNKDEELVDSFLDKDGNFDTYRIFKCPSSCSAESACLIDEGLKRLDVRDLIVSPKGQ